MALASRSITRLFIPLDISQCGTKIQAGLSRPPSKAKSSSLIKVKLMELDSKNMASEERKNCSQRLCRSLQARTASYTQHCSIQIADCLLVIGLILCKLAVRVFGKLDIKTPFLLDRVELIQFNTIG